MNQFNEYSAIAQVAVRNTENAFINQQKLRDESLIHVQEGKSVLSMVVIGHVDAGKSTLMGHLLHQLGFVDKRTMHKFEKLSADMGKASFKYAWVLDNDDVERERGVTMDVGFNQFENLYA